MRILECGCDEAGRGSAIGDIYACAVILNWENPIQGLKDSKKLTAGKRELLAVEIKKHALCWSVAKASLAEIEILNVHQASLLAMKRAIEGLTIRPDKAYIDGKFIPRLDIPAEAIVNGDDKIDAISAASIIAKVSRDQVCLDYHEAYPEYGFDKHKGYLTSEHLNALNKHGPCPLHRTTYAPIRKLLINYEQMKLF